MPCVITDRTTKETESKKHQGSKITIKRITQKCSNYSDDLKEEDKEVIDKEVIDEEYSQELSMEDISNHFSRFMGKHNRDDTYEDIRDFAEAFGEYVDSIKDNMG